MTIPAVGPITALTWALEVGDVKRFSSTNTLLLMVIAGLMAGLLLKPAPRRYEVFQQNYLLDTTSGRVVMIRVSEEVRTDQRAKEAAKQAEKDAAEARDKAYREERLSKTCPEILARLVPKIASRSKGEVPPLADIARNAVLELAESNPRNTLAKRGALDKFLALGLQELIAQH
jgi:hypothetical protein